MKLLWFITTLSTLVTCASCSRSGGDGSALAQNGTRPGPEGTPVSVTKAQQRDLVDLIDLTRNLTADEQVTVYAKVPRSIINGSRIFMTGTPMFCRARMSIKLVPAMAWRAAS